mmetsp:Transcript_52831/g.169170  ORF Transcript_52831/g.169170 Transcript_52831/m.169170 type:complete len:265 (+) Transcript_52831:439-1233(+)
MPALKQSALPPLMRPRCVAYSVQSSIGDQGAGLCSSQAQPSSLSTSVPASCRSNACWTVRGFRCSSSWRGKRARSMTQRIAEKGSRTCASGISMPTICASRGTSKRGKTIPGLSQRQVRSSSTIVCRVLVWPGVAFTLTTLLPMRLLISEDLPTLGWPTRPSITRPASAGTPSASASGFTVPAAAPDLASSRALWQVSMSALRPTCSGPKLSEGKASFEYPTMPAMPGIAWRRHSAHRAASPGATVSSLLSTSTSGFRSVRVTW